LLGTAALLALAAALAAVSAAQPRKKQVKDEGEHELYNQTLLDASDPSHQLIDLDLWTRRYPDSDYKDDRLYLYLQAYSKLDPPQSGHVLEYGARLMARNLPAVFSGPGGGMNVLNVLFLTAWHAAMLPNATDVQLSLGARAARELLDFAPRHFVDQNRPADMSQDQWNGARREIETRAHAALTAIAMAPGNRAMAKEPPDCAAAETAYRGALAVYPADAHISYGLAKALYCAAQADGERAAEFYPQSIYQFVRAAELDPSLGLGDYTVKLYAAYHGSEDGLEQLREQAKAAPLPPEGFSIETPAKTTERTHNELAETSPQIALWMNLRAHLTSDDAFRYFNGQLKNTELAGTGGAKALRGTVVEGRPLCRPKELLVTMPVGTGQAGRAEITLRLESGLPGQAAGEIEFDGTVKLFTKDPLMLTLDSAAKRITGLKTTSCK
jgi:hypothetical protein